MPYVRTCTATLHHLIVALPVGGNKNDLGSKTFPRIFEEFHSIWSSATLFRVPKYHSPGLYMFVD
jgi:hypothetical protein